MANERIVGKDPILRYQPVNEYSCMAYRERIENQINSLKKYILVAIITNLPDLIQIFL